MSEEFNLDMLEEARELFKKRGIKRNKFMTMQEYMEMVIRCREELKRIDPDWEPIGMTVDEFIKAGEEEMAERYFRC